MEINYNAIFSNLDTFTGLPITLIRNKWYGACRYDGTPHRRRDKLCAYMTRANNVRIIEQGEQSLTLWDWLLQFGGCNSNQEVIERLNSNNSGHVEKQYVEEIVRAKYIKSSTVSRTKYNYSDTLFQYLCTVFPEDKVRKAYDLYDVGSTSKKTIFWYRKFSGEFCFDKVITYKSDGHRDKKIVPKRKFLVRDGYTDRCFFGEHLLTDWRNEHYIVESEKTALILYLHTGKTVLATGGSSCIHLCSKSSILLPDNDEAGETWKEWGTNVEWWKNFKGIDIQRGWDIGDAIIAKINYKKMQQKHK